MAETVYNEIVEDSTIAVTTTGSTTAARLIGETYPFKYVIDLNVRLRSLGTGGTYVAIGNQFGQEYRLVAVGNVFERHCRRYEVIDLTKLYITSDVADAVVEVACTFLPFKQYGKVNRVL
jgi:hypothetical protein